MHVPYLYHKKRSIDKFYKAFSYMDKTEMQTCLQIVQKSSIKYIKQSKYHKLWTGWPHVVYLSTVSEVT